MTFPLQTEIALLPEQHTDQQKIRAAALSKLKLRDQADLQVAVHRRSIDARQRQPLYRIKVIVSKGEQEKSPPYLNRLSSTKGKDEIIIVGAGPAGYFAALEAIELGLRPIVLDRGKDVRARRRDLKAIQQDGIVNPHSNYCFGEGGAGTYSDGKLYTRSHKRGNIEKVLQLLVEHGAKSDILIDAHPHIGSNKLPQIITAIRETIEQHGGEVRFGAFVTDLILHQGKCLGVRLETGEEIKAQATVLATGHSARDIFNLLHSKQIKIEAKPFALGVRIEHPQPLIDEIQYKQRPRQEGLPAADYKLVTQVRDRGVFSFCMCPGGLIVPAATAPGELVVNGMSLSRRDSPFANSGLVVAIEEADTNKYKSKGAFAGLAFQKEVETQLFAAGDGSQQAPAQRVTDFLNGNLSQNLPATSYIPGIYSARMDQLLPRSIASRLQQGLRDFDKKKRGYITEEAIFVGAESRTSSPIRIPRLPNGHHPDAEGLFPCGEGAGYAGGIVSAALDGQRVIQHVDTWMRS